METQKIINLLNDSSNEESKFANKKWYVIGSQTAKHKYNEINSIKLKTESIKSSLCDYSDVYILVTEDITVNAGGLNGSNTYLAFKICAPFSTCKTEVNDAFIDVANHTYIAMTMCNLNEYSDNCSDASGSLWHFKRDEVPAHNANLNVNNSQSFKCKAVPVGKTADYVNSNSFVKNMKIVVPLKYLSNFWRSLEMQLINCKFHLE